MKLFAGSTFAMAMLIGMPAHAAPDHIAKQNVAQRDEEQQQERQRGGQGGGQAQQNRGQKGGGAPAEHGARGRGGQNGNRGQVAGKQAPQNRGPAAGVGARGRGQGQVAQSRRGAIAPVEHGPAQFEKRAFQRNVTAPRRFRAAVFRPPVGWQYRRWTYGQYLPPAYWARTYWISSFWLYDLDRPPVGTEWVRSGPDALLIDVTTGEVIEAVYNVFY